jgi:hypothetical protein
LLGGRWISGQLSGSGTQLPEPAEESGRFRGDILGQLLDHVSIVPVSASDAHELSERRTHFISPNCDCA